MDERDPPLPAAWTDLTGAAHALGNNRRVRILQALIDAPVPLRVADLVERTGFHHLSVRAHLTVLGDAGFVTAETAATDRPGRPARRYRPVPGALDQWTTAGPHADLAGMLLGVAAGGTPRAVGTERGQSLVAGLAGGDPLERLDAVIRRFGFEPTRHQRGDLTEVRLHRCPYLNLAAASPTVVCELHRGLADGACRPLCVVDLVIGSPPAEPCRLVVGPGTVAVTGSLPTAGSSPTAGSPVRLPVTGRVGASP